MSSNKAQKRNSFLAKALNCFAPDGEQTPDGASCLPSLTKETPKDHWLPNVPRKGVLGDLLTRVNHYAITTPDVGKTLDFYVNILGLQQIRRPNFDRHGAWLTAGNLEIHLIKGPAIVPKTDSLIVGHLSLETEHVEEVRQRLTAAQVPFTQNVSVPNKDGSTIVTQFFLRDPAGYFIELCNCDILTKFCLSTGSSNKDSLAYNEVSDGIGMFEALQMMLKADHAQKLLEERAKEKSSKLVLPKKKQAKKEDPVKTQNLINRIKTFGGVLQGETEASIRTALRESNNHVPLAYRIIRARQREAGKDNLFVPPAVLVEGREKYQPKPISVRMEAVAKSANQSMSIVKNIQEDPDCRLKKIFKSIDKDDSGSLNRSEVKKFMQSLLPSFTEKEADKFFDDHDHDKSGTVDLKEFLAISRDARSKESKKTWETIFDFCDDDENGALQAPELAHKLQDMGISMGDDEMDELFVDADLDGNGTLCREEFANMMIQEIPSKK